MASRESSWMPHNGPASKERSTSEQVTLFGHEERPNRLHHVLEVRAPHAWSSSVSDSCNMAEEISS